MYTPDVKAALLQVWEACGCICSKCLAPCLPEIVAVLKREGELKSLLLKVVLIRVDARIAFQGSVAWQVRVYPNLAFYLSLRLVGAGVRFSSSTSSWPPPQAPPATT